MLPCAWLIDARSGARSNSITTSVRKAGGAPDVGIAVDGRRASGLGMSGASATIAAREATRVAGSIQVTGVFAKEFAPSLSMEDSLVIAQPVSIDWEDVIQYEGFTTQCEDEKCLFVKFPRVDGWLSDDFVPAILALIELAEVILECDRMFVLIDRQAAELNCVVRSLLYAGFAVQASTPIQSPDEQQKYLILVYETE